MRVLHGVSDIEKSWSSSSAYSTCEQELTLFQKCDFLEILLRRRVLEVTRAWRAEDCSFQKNAILKTPNSENFFLSRARKKNRMESFFSWEGGHSWESQRQLTELNQDQLNCITKNNSGKNPEKKLG